MWSIIQKLRRPRPAEQPERPPDSPSAVRQWLEREEPALLTAIDSLTRLMADPKLGGPGFLTVQIGERITVSCQYPNISETLYQAALRGTAADLLPSELLNRGLRWETESGAVVILTLDAAPAGAELSARLAQLHSRNKAVRTLAEYLSSHYQNFTVRPLAGYILLTPNAASTETQNPV